MEQMCYNCKKPTTVVYWSGITVCVNCGREYDDYDKDVPDVQTGQKRDGVSAKEKKRKIILRTGV